MTEENYNIIIDELYSKLKESGTYSCDTWSYSPAPEIYSFLYKLLKGGSGIIKINNKKFNVTFSRGSNGRGGMDQGTPPSVTVTRVKKQSIIKLYTTDFKD